MKVEKRSRQFGGVARVFEWLLSFLLFAAALGTIATFAFIVRLSFADTVPDYLVTQVEVKIGEKSLPDLDQLPTAKIDHLLGEVTLPPEQVNLYLTHATVAMIGLIISAAVTFNLRQFVRSLRIDHPFVAANAKRLRTVAWLTLFGGIWKICGSIVQISELNRVFPSLDLELSIKGDPFPIVFVLILFVVAEVFALGVKMKEEADLTV